mmetsp:Transcript_30575/g.79755  ORF Transcript_30575/g.79755 Transcript_30575/m.79755 type:complete len:121 (-) Transcript_30575:1372-1734(-)
MRGWKRGITRRRTSHFFGSSFVGHNGFHRCSPFFVLGTDGDEGPSGGKENGCFLSVDSCVATRIDSTGSCHLLDLLVAHPSIPKEKNRQQKCCRFPSSWFDLPAESFFGPSASASSIFYQ